MLAVNKQKLQTGLIAQELFTLFPQAVQEGGSNPAIRPWMIDYSKLTPLLVQAVQDQQQEINDQHQQLHNQSVQIEDLKDQLGIMKSELEILKKAINRH